MSNAPVTEPFALAILLAQREQLRMVLLSLPLVQEEHRGVVRAGAIQLLGAVEDALGYERTYPKRDTRRRERI
jgi:hypothetical protein